MEKPLFDLLSAGFSGPNLTYKRTACADANPTITALVYDSRQCAPGALYFAWPGVHVHGNTYIPSAIEKGASAVIYQDDIPEETVALAEKAGCALIHVTDSRFVMAPVADAFYDSPSSKMVVIGVTGTEGKSTTVFFIWQLLRLLGKKAGFFSTVQCSYGDEATNNPEHQTTPEAPVVQQKLYQMLQNGCEYAVVESSSHGLSTKLNRLGNVQFDIGIMMNVTHEHLEFHGTHEQYKSDKANLFRALARYNHKKVIGGVERQVTSFGIVNGEDPSARYFADAVDGTCPVYAYTTNGLAGAGAGKNGIALPELPAVHTLLAQAVDSREDTVSFSLSRQKCDGAAGDIRLSADTFFMLNMGGAFNVYNAMATLLAVSGATGTDIASLTAEVSRITPVKGRMTTVKKGQPFEVIVDYAHTPSSFNTIFPPIRKRCTGRMIVVFGSGGERDTAKRPEQGRIASEFCDIVILADEDPRGEDPVALLEDIAVGAEKNLVRGESLLIIPHRQDAIRKAFALAGAGDIVLLLGKAHENSIIYKDFTMPYDEITEAETALAEIGFTN